MAVSREKLYEEVWAEAMTTVAARYDVSSNFLARVCRRLNVPHPPRGYWAKRKVGKSAARPPLPDPRPGDELEWSRDGEPRRQPQPLPQPPQQPITPRSPQRADRPARHPLIVGAREHFVDARVTQSGYLKPWKQVLVDVFVSKDVLSRALDLASDLFLALEDRGHTVVIARPCHHFGRPTVDHRDRGGDGELLWDRWCPARPTVVFIGTVGIGITLFELSENVEVRYSDKKYVRIAMTQPRIRGRRAPTRDWTTLTGDMPSGRLALRAFSPYARTTWEKQWREAKAGDLANSFPAIAKELEDAAVVIAKLAAESERQAEIERQRREVQRREWEAQEVERRRQEAERRRKQAHIESRDQLLAIVEAWALAGHLERFFEEAVVRAAALPDEERSTVLARLERARALVGGTDTLAHFRAWKSPEER